LLKEIAAGSRNVFDSLLVLAVFDKAGVQLHESTSPSFLYRTTVDGGAPVVYAPAGGRVQLKLNTTAMDAYFNALGAVADFGTNSPVYRLAEDVIDFSAGGSFQSIYSHAASMTPAQGTVLGSFAGQGYTLTDSGNYTTPVQLTFREQNRYGSEFTYTLTFKIHFIAAAPSIEFTFNDNPGIVLSEGAEASVRNTISTKHLPNLDLGYIANVPSGSRYPDLFGPYSTTESYVISRLENSSWVDIRKQTSEAPYVGFKIPTFVAGGVALGFSQGSSDPMVAGKYRIQVRVRNKIGNIGEGAGFFYIDAGVAAKPRISWEYTLPTRPIPGGALPPGKQAGNELDFDKLLQLATPIVRLRVYDDGGFSAAEGFGPGSGTGSGAGVYLLKDPNKGSPYAPDDLILPTAGGPKIDVQSGDSYYEFSLTQADFLRQAGQGLRQAPYALTWYDEGTVTIMTRTVSVPVNTWNKPFKVTVLYRDRFENEVVSSNMTTRRGFSLSFDGSIYSPAFYPDLSVSQCAASNGSGLPSPGDPLDISFAPVSVNGLTAGYTLRVIDEGTGAVILEETSYEGVATLNGLLRYEGSYRVIVSGKNANGYTTLPASVYIFKANRDDLTINISGTLSSPGDRQEWNWKYRLIGDVIVPGGFTLVVKSGAEVEAPRLPKVFADKRTKLIVKSGGRLQIDGGGGFDPRDHLLDPNAFINFVPSGLTTRLGAGGNYESYAVSRESTWGGIYFERGFDASGSFIRRARISGAYDGILVLGAGAGGSGGRLAVSDSALIGNYIGIEAVGDASVGVSNSVIAMNLEYGVKTDGTNYAVDVTGDSVSAVGGPNRYADYYSSRMRRRLSFEEFKNNSSIRKAEGGDR
jgi:hypothetical protein